MRKEHTIRNIVDKKRTHRKKGTQQRQSANKKKYTTEKKC